MSSAAERPVLLGRSIRLQQENFLDDLLDAGLLCGEVTLRVAAGHAEPSGQNSMGDAHAQRWR